MDTRFGPALLVCVGAVPVWGGVLRVPSEYATINAALDVASCGDSVLVAPGTYDQYETRLLGDGIWFSSVAFLRGDVSLVSEGGASVTTLRMDSTVEFPVVMRAYGETGTSLVQGFTTTGTVAGLDGFGCTFGGRWILRDCVFQDIGTGASGEGAVGTVKADLEVYRCRFENINGGSGSAIYQTSSTLVVEDSEFLNCRSGAVRLRYDSSFQHPTSLEMRRCRFVGNQKTTGEGGGITVRLYSSVLIEDCWFEGNQSNGGGGAVAAGPPAVIRGNTFVRNTVVGGGFGGAVLASGVVTGNTFWGNSGPNWPMGGAAVVLAGGSQLLHNVIAGSYGDEAVGVETGSGSVETTCNVFWANQDGDAIFPLSPSDLPADPLFCDVLEDDFRVSAGSPCLPGQGAASCVERIGAWDEGCGTVALSPRTWGRVKNEFRAEVIR